MVRTGSVVWDDRYIADQTDWNKAADVIKQAANRVREAARVEGTPVHAFLCLATPDASWMTSLAELQQDTRKHIDAVVVLGIGGSYLGAKVLTELHCGPYWNMDETIRDGYPELYFSGYTADADAWTELDRHLERRAMKSPSYRIRVVIITKSGTTSETLAAWLYLRSQWEARGQIYDVVTVTDKGREQAIPYADKAMHWYIPDAVGGRFSVFTAAGLVPAAMVGVDMAAFYSGLAAHATAVIKGAGNNAALQAAWMKYQAWQTGLMVEVCMPYTMALEGVSDWYAQLLAESLGKKESRDGKILHYGRVPVCAVGTRDMHSMTQEHQEGAYNKLIQFIDAPTNTDIHIPPSAFIWGDRMLSELQMAALNSNEQALAKVGRSSCRVQIPGISIGAVGELMYFFCWAIIYEAEMANVNAFDQPGVEVYKSLMREVAQPCK